MRLIAEDLWTTIDGPYPSGLLDPVTAFRPEGYFFSPAYKHGHSDGYVRFVKKDRHSEKYGFPTGLLARVLAFLEKKEWRYSLEDRRTFEQVTPNYELLDGNGTGQRISLDQGRFAFQASALDALCMHGRGILKAGTGGGKTTIAASLINSIGRCTIWLTHRQSLMYQTRERLQNHFGRPVGILGDGRSELHDVTVAMMQTVSNVLKGGPEKHLAEYWFLMNAEVVIGDEGHRLEGRQFYDAFSKVPARWRYLLTATPKTEGEGLFLMAQTGPVIYEITPAELIRHKVLVPPRIWFVRYPIVPLPKKIPWATAYADGVVKCYERNKWVVSAAAQFAFEKKPALTLIIRIKHGEELKDLMEARGIRVAYIHGKVRPEKRAQLFEQLSRGELDHIIAQATTVGEGTDLPWLRALINATGLDGGGDKTDGDTGKDTLQFLGRGLRSFKDKPHFDYVDFFDTSHKTLKRATLARVNTLESEGYGAYIKYWDQYCDDSMVVAGR